jgi:hypothetical protein
MFDFDGEYDDDFNVNHIGVSIVVTIGNMDLVIKKESHAHIDFQYRVANDMLAELITKAEAVLSVDELVGQKRVNLIDRDTDE